MAGLVVPASIHCAPWSKGKPKVVLSVTARPPIRSRASTTSTLLCAAIRVRAAARPATPAPTITTSSSAARAGQPMPNANTVDPDKAAPDKAADLNRRRRFIPSR